MFKYIFTFIGILLIFYTSLITEMPNNISNFYDNDIIKLITLFSISFIISKNTKIALLSTIGIMIIYLLPLFKF